MLRVRFHTSSVDDPRPVKFPPPGPWWCTGEAGDGSYATVVAYVEKIGQVKKFWPEAKSLDHHATEEPVFNGRFPKPKWWKL